MEIKSFHTQLLRNEEAHQYFSDFILLVNSESAETLGIATQFASFTSLANQLSTGLQQIKASMHTKKVADADQNRDDAYRGIYTLIKAYCMHYDNEMADAALRLRKVFNNFGDPSAMPYFQETATITTLTNELTTKWDADLTKLGIKVWVQELVAMNTIFNSLLTERTVEEAEKPKVNIKQTRQEIDKIYSTIVKRINALMLLNGETQYLSFANKLNEMIDGYRNLTAIRKGRNAGGENKVTEEQK